MKQRYVWRGDDQHQGWTLWDDEKNEPTIYVDCDDIRVEKDMRERIARLLNISEKAPRNCGSDVCPDLDSVLEEVNKIEQLLITSIGRTPGKPVSRDVQRLIEEIKKAEKDLDAIAINRNELSELAFQQRDQARKERDDAVQEATKLRLENKRFKEIIMDEIFNLSNKIAKETE